MVDNLSVRSYRAADANAVARLWDEVFRNDRPWHEPLADVRRKEAQRDELLLVGVVDDDVVATILIGYDGHRGWLYRVAVAESQRRRGFGRAMVAAAEQRLRALGCPKLNLQVEGSNRAVVGFYERLGYAVEDRVSMGKPL